MVKISRTKLVGVLNVTPDSFSDGGKFNSLDGALSQLEIMLKQGADMIDIGAESTRPNHVPVNPNQEWERLEKILPAIVQKVKDFNKKFAKNVTTSIDTRHFQTANNSYELGVDIINDVSGLVDENIIDLIAKKGVTTVLMHNDKIDPLPGIVINKNPNLNDEIINWAEKKITYLLSRGVKKSQLIFDVGIGFGKNANQSIRILKYIDIYKTLGLPLYIGHSKKSFLDAVNFSNFPDGESYNRSQKTLIISKYLAQKNIDFLRVHDVKDNLLVINQFL